MTDSESIKVQGTKKELMQLIPQLVALRTLIESRDIGTVFIDDNASPPVRRRGKPKISLYFVQDSNFKSTGTQSTKSHGKRRRDGVISFRLMDESPATFSEANQKAIAQRIKQVFGANGGFVWEKGKDLYAYTDWDLGYQLELLTKTETEARRITTSVLSIQGHTPDWSKFTHSKATQPESKYPVVPGRKIIAGQEVELIEQRPVVDVRFHYAYATVEGLIDPIGLYDRRGKLKSVVIT